MKILWIDTASKGCNTAIGDETGVLAFRCDDMERGQSEHLMPMIDNLLKDAGVHVKDIERISVCRGPGSFTGVRIGLAVGRMFSRVLNIPCIGFSTFDIAMEAIDIPIDINYGISIHSFRKEPYLQVFRNNKPLTVPLIAHEDVIEKYNIETLFLNQFTNYFDFSSINKKIFNLSQSEIFFKKILIKSRIIINIEEFPTSPMYIRSADVQMNTHAMKAVIL